MYSELFCQSNYSFLHGASSPEELINTASFLGYSALAITDECSVSGVVRAYSQKSNKHLPCRLIVGSYLRFNDDLHLVLLSPNKIGYTELCRVISNARKRSPKGEYQLDKWDLQTLRQCFCLWLPSLQMETDKHWGVWLQKHFKERLWIAAQRLLDDKDDQRFDHYIQLNRDLSLPIVACTGALMHHSQRLSLQHTLHAIRVGKTVSTLGKQALINGERCLRPLNKLNKLYPSAWLKETENIAAQCQFCLSELKYQYPAELVPHNYSASAYLRHCVEQGINKRFPDGLPQSIRLTIEKELALIAEQQYEYFFLTLYDIVNFAKQRGILYQGRGSAANSVVCYCLEITAVDPRQVDVLFERFISKERDEPPDIDVDFEHERREEIIQYIYQKYGRERTALAATVICYRLKSALRDVGKALGFAETQLDFIIKSINRRDRALTWQAQIKNLGLDENAQSVQQLVALVEEIIGFPRHLSQHVGGFVISSGPLYELVPIENAAMPERTVIQWDKEDIETLGLLKVDVLALGMLTSIRKAFELIEQHYHYSFDIPFITRLGDDKQVFDMLCQADTVGVFQIESRAQMSMLPRLKPRCYYDLVVQIAIVRPGPIQGDMVHPYLKRRHKKESISYPSTAVADVLERTMGVPIFQEQVIKLAMVAAGFTGGEADQLRRAMASWKKDGRLYEFEDKLVQGMLARGYHHQFAHRLFEQIKGFGGYGFPESHSASFAVLAYVSSWLKYYFPAAFYCALLNSQPMGFYTPSQIIQDAKRRNITVFPVCINQSDYDHTLCLHDNQYAIRLGLRLVKNLPTEVAHTLIIKRPERGYFSVQQIAQAIQQRDALEALASANALQNLTNNRFHARWEIMDQQPSLPLFTNGNNGHHLDQQKLVSIPAPSLTNELVEDYAALGLSLNYHPIQLIEQHRSLTRFTFANDLIHLVNKSVVHIIGCVTGKQAPGTASGVTFITLEDHTGNINVVVWQATARHQQKPFVKATILQVDGILERSPEGVIHVIAGKLTDRTQWLSKLNINSREFR